MHVAVRKGSPSIVHPLPAHRVAPIRQTCILPARSNGSIGLHLESFEVQLDQAPGDREGQPAAGDGACFRMRDSRRVSL